MSRLRPVSIPFVSGHDDSRAAEVLPDGTFADVRNGRLNQLGQLRLRRGWRPVAMVESGSALTVSAYDLYSYRDSLVALGTIATAGARTWVLGTFVNQNTTRPWRLAPEPVPPCTDVVLRGNQPPLENGRTFGGSSALTADGSIGVTVIQWLNIVTSTLRTTWLVFRTDTNETIATGEFANGSRLRKVVSIGTTFLIAELTSGTAFNFSTLNPTSASPAWTSLGSAFAIGAAPTNDSMDLGVARTTTPGAFYVVWGEASACKFAKFSTAAVQQGATKTLFAAQVDGVRIVCDDVTASAVYQRHDTSALEGTVFAATGTFTTSVASTSLLAGEAIGSGSFVLGATEGLAANLLFLAATSGVVTAVRFARLTQAALSVQISLSYNQYRVVGGFVSVDKHAAWGADRQTAAADSHSQYVDENGPWWVDDYGLASPNTTQPIFAAQSQTTHALMPTLQNNAPGQSMPVFRFGRVGTTARRPGAQLGDSLYVTGGVPLQFSGSDVLENGQLTPLITAAVQSTATGSMVAGTYTYLAVQRYTDELTQDSFSIVSRPFAATITGGNNTNTVTIQAAKGLRRNPNLVTNPRVELYRTEAGPGELFYLTATAVADTTADATTLVDTKSDASLVSQTQIYTEGETGATSGVLEIAPPSAASYVGAMRDRLVLGGGSQVQFSNTRLPNEPATFTQPGVSGGPALAYFATVADPITALTALDDTVVIGTRDSIYLMGGDGPNLAGVGEFQSPTRLPSDVGVFDWRSLNDTAEGLWFVANAAGALFRLPRGGGSPEFAGLAVQNRFAAGAVGGAVETTDDVAFWACADATAVVRDLRHGLWFGDSLPFTPASLVAHRGQLYAVDSAGVVWTQGATFGDGASGASAVVLQAATGQIAAFGLGGWGRAAAYEVLGVYESDATVLLEASYDDGATFTGLGSFSITGLAAGTVFQRQWYPATQRGDRFRLRVTMTPASTTAEGCRLSGFVVYLDTRSGPTRVASASRK